MQKINIQLFSLDFSFEIKVIIFFVIKFDLHDFNISILKSFPAIISDFIFDKNFSHGYGYIFILIT